jgi:hypothetical protein
MYNSVWQNYLFERQKMGLFKGMKDSREQQKAKAFYDNGSNNSNNSRDSRKTKSILGNRCSAFINLTFIEGANKTVAYIEEATLAQSQGKPIPPQPSTSAYKEVRTMGGKVWVYLPQSYTNQIFALGSKYQQDIVSKDRALEIAASIADEITQTLELDHPINPLQFLVSDEEEEAVEDLEGEDLEDDGSEDTSDET